MSTRHLLDTEGAVVCGATAAEDGSNVTSHGAGVTCLGCLYPKTYLTALRTAAEGMPYRWESDRREVVAWLREHRPEALEGLS
jgi:hypothetical protein